MTAWKLIGSICTTNSAACPEKLRQKAMAKYERDLTDDALCVADVDKSCQGDSCSV